MKNFLSIAAIAGTLMGAVALAQSTAPTDPTAQPPSTQTTPQSSQAPTAAPTQAPQSSQPATTPAPGGASSEPANSQSASSQAPNTKRVAPGSVIPVQLTKTIDAKKAKTGDQVVAKVTQDMTSSNGQVVVAKDTKVIGHVTQAQPRSKEQKESELAVAFDRAVTKDGQEMQMPMSIQAVIGQQNNENAAGGGNDQSAPSNSGSPSTSNAGAGRSPMGGASNQGQPSSAPSASDNGGGQQSSNGARPPINAQTQGVIGISNLNLQPGTNGSQGSVMTSEKNNVKLESGTMLLLKVNQ